MSIYIYGLKDPRDQQIYYVGASSDPERRLIDHMSDTCNQRKREWLNGLKCKGLKPDLVILDTTDEENWRAQEKHWIKQGVLKHWPLTNVSDVPIHPDMAIAGHTANQIAAKYAFPRYQERKTKNTLRAQRAALNTFSEYLAYVNITVSGEALYSSPHAWDGMTYGLVSGFVQWMASQGYAIGTINAKLAHVKTYAKLASQAQVIDGREYALISTVAGYSARDGRNLDQKRATKRISTKKALPTPLTRAQADQLMAQPNTPQGRRDALMMALFLEHGLRVSEIEALDRYALTDQTLSFYQPKTNKRIRHDLTDVSAGAAKAYLKHDGPAFDGLLRGSRKGGALTDYAMRARAIRKRVGVLGERVGVKGLSPHDLRHAWATFATRAGTGVRELQNAGGWASPAMPLRYAAAAEIANTGVKLR